MVWPDLARSLLASSPRAVSPRLWLFNALTYDNSLEGPHSAPFVDEPPQEREKAQGRGKQDGEDFPGQWHFLYPCSWHVGLWERVRAIPRAGKARPDSAWYFLPFLGGPHRPPLLQTLEAPPAPPRLDVDRRVLPGGPLCPPARARITRRPRPRVCLRAFALARASVCLRGEHLS